MNINNKKYWDQRFVTDWESKLGREQSRFFAQVAVENLPEWFTQHVLFNHPKICDWGCAEGDGTDVLAAYFGQRQVQGVDFSDIAIHKAKQYYPELTFKSEDWLKTESPNNAKYDIIFSSNTLEHFSEPRAVFKTISLYAKQMVVLMFPFREFERLAEHYYTFLPENIQIVPTSDFVLLHAQIIDTSELNPTYWSGEQILLIYGRTDWVSSKELPLSYMYKDVKLGKSLIIENAHRKDIAEKEQVIQGLSLQVAEKEQMIQGLSSKLTDEGRIITARDEGISWLRNELAQAKSEIQQIHTTKFWRVAAAYWSLRAVMAKATLPVRHPIKWLMQKNVRQSIVHILPAPTKQIIKKFLGHSMIPAPSTFSGATAYSPIITSRHGDFYDSLIIRPGISAEQLPGILEHPPVKKTLHLPDVICFSIIDWDFRFQRPQQIMSQFAAKGHRVFYISTTQFQSISASPSCTVRNIKENIYEISLTAQRPPDVYGESIDGENLKLILASLDELRRTYQIESAISYVMIASWGNVALETQQKWGWQVIYDCMDEWNNFPLIKRAIIDAELNLVQKCDLLVVTSQRLYDTWKKYNRPMALVRNATDYIFYEKRYLPNEILPEIKHPVIGYYGAIADWFDLELMTYVAKNRPDYTFILLGGVFDLDVSKLKALPNVRLLGQQPYETMPQYLFHFDVCIIPFKINSITEATDPVKIYEYLCGGKPVVSVELPEIKSYSELLYLAKDRDDFLIKLDEAVVEDDPGLAVHRKVFAQQNTWDERYEQILSGLTEITRPVSIIVVTFENLALTKLCLESIIRNTEYLNYEIIVVDNNSTDGTPDYLRSLAKQYSNVSLILNTENNGFAKANNQGLAQSTGEYLILLNNDTIVPPHWINRLIHYIQDSQIGLVGPMTNFVGNEAKLNVTYGTWGEMESFAKDYMWKNEGLASEIHMLAMYCVAFRRDVFQIVGPLDEQFGIGMFEDDDYSMRMRQKGYRVICAQDIFVHHFGQAAFGKLIQDGSYGRIFEKNRRWYEDKWNTKWTPHKNVALSQNYRFADSLAKLTDDVRQYQEISDQHEDYAQKIKRENIKWGQHLKVEASGEWNAWLDHPLIADHYKQRSLIDDLPWEEWANKYLIGPAEKSLDLGCGAGERSLAIWRANSSKFIEGIDVSEDRVSQGERRRRESGASGQFKVADVNTVVLPENTYDLIFSAHSFHHFLKLEYIMEQVSHSLTDRGLFILEEFVGPTQFQWTDLQIKHTKDILSSLPSSLRVFRDGRLKIEEGRPTPEEVMAVSPFESIRSAEIWPLFQQYFEVVAVRKLGGTIQHLLYNGIVHNFNPANQIANQHIQRIIDDEDRLINSDKLPSDFMLLVGRRRKI